MKVSPIRLGVLGALVLGLWHAAWTGLVSAGLAQPLLDWIFRLHFLSQPFDVQPFDLTTAATLVGVTAGLGFVLGLVVGVIWNAVYSSAKPPAG